MQNKETIRKFQGICPEKLLYVSDEFHIKARYMDMDAKQMWSDWPKCLEPTPKKVWDKILLVWTYNQTENGLKRVILQLLKHYARDPCAKNTMIKNIMKQFRKPPEQEVYGHFP